MFKNAFYVVATFSFIFAVVALVVGVDPTEYNFINIIDKISRVEFPDILGIFENTLINTKNNMYNWEMVLPSWLDWLDDISSPWIWAFHFIKEIWTSVIQLINFIINFCLAILPVSY